MLRRVFFLVSFFSKSMGGMTDDDICPRSICVWVSPILSRSPNLVHGRPAVNRGSCISRPLSACNCSDEIPILEMFKSKQFSRQRSTGRSAAQFQRPHQNLVRRQMFPHTFQNLQDICVVAMNTQGLRHDLYFRT